MKRTTKGGGLPRAKHIDQTNLFGRQPGAGDVGPATRRSHPITSHRAASKAADKLTVKQLAVLGLMQECRRVMTHEQIVIEYREARSIRPWGRWYPDLTDSSIRTRVKELATLGYVEVLDENGRSERGNKAQRWQLTSAGVLADVAKLRPVE